MINPEHEALKHKYYKLEKEILKKKKTEIDKFASFVYGNQDTMSIAFKDLNIWAPIKKRKSCCKSENTSKWILHSLSGKFSPGTMTAI